MEQYIYSKLFTTNVMNILRLNINGSLFQYLKEQFENKGYLSSFDQSSFLNVMIYYCLIIKNNNIILNVYYIISKEIKQISSVFKPLELIFK